MEAFGDEPGEYIFGHRVDLGPLEETLIYSLHQLIGILLASAAFSVFVGMRSSKLLGVTLFYFLNSYTFIFINPTSRYIQFQNNVDSSAAQGFAILMLVAFVCSMTTGFRRHIGWFVFCLAMLANGTAVYIFGYGMFNAHSFDTAMIATAVVMMAQFWPWMIPGAVILATMGGGSSPYFIYLFQGAGYFRKVYFWIPIAVVAVFGIGYLMEGDRLFESYDRVDVWKQMMVWWWNHCDIWFGAGGGTFTVLGPKIQLAENPNMKNGIFLMMHNEYLQVLFEQGIVGFILAGAAWAQALWKSIRRPWLFATLLGMSFVMFVQFPLRFFLSAVIIGLLVMEANDDDSQTKSIIGSWNSAVPQNWMRVFDR